MWKVIETHPNYEVSDQGQVKNIKTQRMLKPYDKGNGYLEVLLNGEKLYVHKLVAEYFVDNPDGLKMVDHIDRNPQNNKKDNLRYVTHSQNMRNRCDNRKVLNETTGDEFDCVAAAVDWLVAQGLSKNRNSGNASLYYCLKGKTKTCGRCEWRYIDGK